MFSCYCAGFFRKNPASCARVTQRLLAQVTTGKIHETVQQVARASYIRDCSSICCGVWLEKQSSEFARESKKVSLGKHKLLFFEGGGLAPTCRFVKSRRNPLRGRCLNSRILLLVAVPVRPSACIGVVEVLNSRLYILFAWSGVIEVQKLGDFYCFALCPRDPLNQTVK